MVLNRAENILLKTLTQVLPEFSDDLELILDSELYAGLYIDSRRFLEIIRSIENSLNYEIDDEDILNADLITVKDLVDFVDKLISQKEEVNDTNYKS
jgi:acyl carrier protein